MDWLHRLSIYISIILGFAQVQTKGIDAELAAFNKPASSKISPLYPIHSFVVIRSQHLQWQK
ncbi:MAG: hypothetical protein KME28_10830 [Pelatocladus maniniholoensis HA4357-MV3]|uniref:Uncharacterized protein n=1 Tax=Pelatocladus maniniholoensis HA4357-MV3 TaxID=1117104 RepID=A0A9E3H8L1_9NOST|nr:hypothetical protein [Pelatocladus maniniholoensis HA4357-MV3]